MTRGGPGPLDETWQGWASRVAVDLAELTDADWLTFSVRGPAAFIQARRLEGMLALELIGDTEFEGLTDLTSAQLAALTGLGWISDGRDPEFERTFPAAAGAEAAALLRATLADVLGAGSPADVDVRRAPRP